VPFDWPLTPRQRHRRLNGSQIRSEPSGEASEGRQGALGGMLQPWVELGGLAMADDGGKALCERDALRQLRRLCGQLCQLLVILCRRPFRRTQDQPGRPPWREGASWRLRHRRQRLRTAPLPGSQPLGLAHPADI
jgi:hypothetical protein